VKKVKYIALLIISILLWSPIVANASSNIAIDTNRAKEGIVRISYEGLRKKTKVMVKKDSTVYYYDLKNEEDSFPLQLGDGNYTISVLENVSGEKYKLLTEKRFRADIIDENAVFLKSTQPVLWDEDKEAIKLANELSKGKKSNQEVVQAIYEYIVTNIDYDYTKLNKLSSDYTPDIDVVLKDSKGICYDYSVLFAAMLRSQGIPAKLVKGYRVGINAYHAWNEVYINNRWEIIDTTIDSYMLNDGTSHNMFQDKNNYNKLKEY